MIKQSFYYKAILRYNGTLFKGFQWQQGVKTIQGELDQALFKILSSEVKSAGASRTDSGVHALGQVVKFSTEASLNASDLKAQLNETLPPEIICRELEPCDESFNPIKLSTNKEYRYLFTSGIDSREQGERFIANVPYDLNLKEMKTCAEMIIGEHDFKNFSNTGSNVKSTVREIFHCELTEVNPHDILDAGLFPLPNELQQCYEFRIVGSGFLKQMVRLLVGHLWQVGRGRLSSREFSHLLSGGVHKNELIKAATPRGLYLYKVSY